MIRRACSIGAALLYAAGAAHAQAKWTLTETLRIGGAETGPAMLNYVKSIEADSRGRILIYDRSTQDIRMFAPDGKFIRKFGRLGSGPGELRDAEGLVIARDGRIWVRDAANTRFTVFSAEGVYERGWTVKFCSAQGAWDAHVDRTGRIIAEDCSVGGTGVGHAVLAYHTDMSRVDKLSENAKCGSGDPNRLGSWVLTRPGGGTGYQSIPWWPFATTAAGQDGEFWCVPTTARYEILRSGPDAADTMRIVRTNLAVAVTEAERDSVVDVIEQRGPKGLDRGRVPKVKPAIDRLTVDDLGRLWVQRTKAKGVIEFDVFSSRGRIIATAELGAVRISRFLPLVIRGDHVYAVGYDEDDIQSVVRYKIGR